MKKIFGLLLIFALVIMSLSGCNQSSSSTSLPEATAAASAGTLAKYSLSMDNAILGVVGITAAGNLVGQAPSDPSYGSDGWWSSSDSYSTTGITYTISYAFKMWRSDGTLVSTQSLLDNTSTSNLGDVWTYTTYSITNSSGTFSMSIGDSKTVPLKFANYLTSETLDGPITYTSTYNGSDYSCTLDYDTLSVNASGYPTGSVTITWTYGGSTAYTATMTFNGTATATMLYSTGTSYTIDLNAGTAVATSF